jgi:excisionase family DNA binding protein
MRAPSAYTEREAASLLRVSIHTIRAWRYQRRLGYSKLGRSVRIPHREIRRLLRRSAVPAVRRPVSALRARAAEPLNRMPE